MKFCLFCDWDVLYLLTKQGRIQVYECERCGTVFNFLDDHPADLGGGTQDHEGREA